jgi:hypothetical protein
MYDLYFVLAGFFVGTVVGLTGVGGGSLMTPILIFFLGVQPHMAVGTDLLFAAITKSCGTFSLWRRQLVPWRVVINECIELAKEFGGTDGHKYVNAVLNGLAPSLRPLEVAADKSAPSVPSVIDNG